MITWQIIYGVLGAGMTLGASYYALRTLSNFREHEDVSMEMLLLQDRTVKSFSYLVTASMFYALISMSVSAGLLPDNWVYDIGVLGLFAGNLYFVKMLDDVTQGH